MESKLTWPFPNSKSKASSKTSSTKSEVTEPKAKMSGANKEETQEERKPRSLSLFSAKSPGDSNATSRGTSSRKLSLHEWWKGADSRAPGVAARQRSSSAGANQFWKAMESSEWKSEDKGKKTSGLNKGQWNAKLVGSGVLGLTGSIRKRCEGFANPKPVSHEGIAPAKKDEGKQSRVVKASDAGDAEKQRDASTSTGAVPERHSLVMQKIHSFENIMRQRHPKKRSQQERPTKTPAVGPSAPSSGNATVGQSTERKGRSKSVSSVLYGARAQLCRADKGKLEGDQVPSELAESSGGTAKSHELLEVPAISERTTGHNAPSVDQNQSAGLCPIPCSSSSEKPNGTYGFGKASGSNVVTDQEMAKRSSNDSVIVLPRTTSQRATAQPSPDLPSRDSSSGQEAADSSAVREGNTASKIKGPLMQSSDPRRLPGHRSEAPSQSLPLNASPSLPRLPPRAAAGTYDLGESARESETIILELLRQSLATELPGSSSPLSSWPELDSPLEKAALSPVVKSDDEGSLSDESVVTIQSDISQLDRSFSISLAELRECGMECREDVRRGDRLENSASLSSNMSFMSVVSLIPNDELDRLLDEVRCLEEETLQCAEDIQVVVLHKEEGAGLGFSIAGGVDHENKMVTAHRVFPSGLAAQEGTIEQGDEILSINGNSLKGLTHSEALAYLHKARPPKQAIVVARKVTEAERAAMRKGSVSNEVSRGSIDLGEVPGSLGESVTVELMKNSAGLGFSLDGGKSSSQGDRPLTIKKVFQGGSAYQAGLIQPGDQLLQVHGDDCRDLTCYEAWNLIKTLPEGPVLVVIQKRQEGATGQQR